MKEKLRGERWKRKEMKKISRRTEKVDINTVTFVYNV